VSERASGASGAWVDLVAFSGDEDVLVATPVGDAALLRLGQRVGQMSVVAPATGDVHRLDGLLAEVSAVVQAGPLDDFMTPGRTFDVLVAVPRQPADIERLAHLVGAQGRLVLLTDNPGSLLRAADRVIGRGAGPTAGRLRTLRRSLARSGLDTVVVFGLLRSSAEPTTAFRLDLPRIADTVLEASAAGSGRARRWAIGALRVASRWGVAAQLVSAWLIVGSRGPGPAGDLTPTGRIAVASNEQGAVLLGSGPDAVEKRFADPAQLEAAAAALSLLGAVGVDVGTRVIGRLAGDRLRTSWVPGRHLDVLRLSPDALTHWLERAAAVLGDIQRATQDDDGQVLVHGDYWLGCVVVDHDSIAGVIDWTDAHRGDPRTDMQSLVAVIDSRSDLRPHDRLRMIAAVQRGHRQAGGPPSACDGLNEQGPGDPRRAGRHGPIG